MPVLRGCWELPSCLSFVRAIVPLQTGRLTVIVDCRLLRGRMAPGSLPTLWRTRPRTSGLATW